MRRFINRHPRFVLAAVFGLALLLRIVSVIYLKRLPFFDHPIMDASYHNTWAREILAGHLTKNEPFFRAPLYPYFLAFVYLLSKGSYLFPRLVQAVMGAATAVISFSLAGRYFGRLAAIVTGMLCATYPLLIYFDGELLTETLFIMLSMLGLLLLELAASSQRKQLWFAAGISLGLALITRPMIALFLPFAAGGAIVFARRRVLAVAALAAGIAIPLAPVTIHNYAVSGEFIPVVWQGGLNFYLGNNPSANGWSATSPELRKDWLGGYEDMIAIPRATLGREPTYTEISDYWTQRGLAFIRQKPLKWADLTARKIGLFWSRQELPNNQDFNFMKMYSWVLRNPVVTFGTAAPLALAGIFALWPKRRRLVFLYGLALTSFAGTVAFFVCDRYRLPSVPPLLVFAGGFAAFAVALAKTRKKVNLAVWIAVLAVAAIAVNANLTGVRLPDFAQSYCGLAQAYSLAGNDDQAARYLETAIKTNPAWAEAYEQLGLLKMKQGDSAAAASLFEGATRVQPDFAAPYRDLAMIYLSEGKVAEARRAAENALRISPFLEGTNNVLGSIERQEGQPRQAIGAFLKETEIDPANWRAYANLGNTYTDIDSLDQAAAAYEKSLEINPDNPEVAIALADVETRRGRTDAARAILDRLKTAETSDLNLKYNRAVILQNSGDFEQAAETYQEVLSADPRHEGALVNLGVIRAKEGRSQDALDLWNRALAVNPANRTARRNIELLKQRNG